MSAHFHHLSRISFYSFNWFNIYFTLVQFVFISRVFGKLFFFFFFFCQQMIFQSFFLYFRSLCVLKIKEATLLFDVHFTFHSNSSTFFAVGFFMVWVCDENASILCVAFNVHKCVFSYCFLFSFRFVCISFFASCCSLPDSVLLSAIVACFDDASHLAATFSVKHHVKLDAMDKFPGRNISFCGASE